MPSKVVIRALTRCNAFIQRRTVVILDLNSDPPRVYVVFHNLPGIVFVCLKLHPQTLTGAHVPDLSAQWVVNGSALGYPPPLGQGFTRVQVRRIDADPPREKAGYPQIARKSLNLPLLVAAGKPCVRISYNICGHYLEGTDPVTLNRAHRAL
jgi:hypothetical protein